LRTDQPRGGLGHVSPPVRINKLLFALDLTRRNSLSVRVIFVTLLPKPKIRYSSACLHVRDPIPDVRL